jgi:hypothetical protein
MEWLIGQGEFGPVPMTIAGVLASGLGVCGLVIRALYASSQKRFERVETKLDECEKDRLNLWEKQSEHYAKIMETLGTLARKQ